jgi:hypothetical protein
VNYNVIGTEVAKLDGDTVQIFTFESLSEPHRCNGKFEDGIGNY